MKFSQITQYINKIMLNEKDCYDVIFSKWHPIEFSHMCIF